MVSYTFFFSHVWFKNADSAAYYGDRADKCAGAFYGGDGTAVATAIVFILAVIAWVGATCFILFTVIKMTVGMRVSKEMEVSMFVFSLGPLDAFPLDFLANFLYSSCVVKQYTFFFSPC